MFWWGGDKIITGQSIWNLWLRLKLKLLMFMFTLLILPEPPVSLLLVFTLRQMYTSKQTHKHPPSSPLTSENLNLNLTRSGRVGLVPTTALMLVKLANWLVKQTDIKLKHKDKICCQFIWREGRRGFHINRTLYLNLVFCLSLGFKLNTNKALNIEIKLI